MMKKSLIYLFSIVILSSCTPKTAEIIEVVEEKEIAVDDMAAIESGKVIYMSDCNKCHKAKNIKDYSESQWDVILPNMAKKSKITADQEAQVRMYIRAELAK